VVTAPLGAHPGVARLIASRFAQGATAHRPPGSFLAEHLGGDVIAQPLMPQGHLVGRFLAHYLGGRR
jgi:hypothetical protein